MCLYLRKYSYGEIEARRKAAVVKVLMFARAMEITRVEYACTYVVSVGIGYIHCHGEIGELTEQSRVVSHGVLWETRPQSPTCVKGGIVHSRINVRQSAWRAGWLLRVT